MASRASLCRHTEYRSLVASGTSGWSFPDVISTLRVGSMEVRSQTEASRSRTITACEFVIYLVTKVIVGGPVLNFYRFRQKFYAYRIPTDMSDTDLAERGMWGLPSFSNRLMLCFF